VSDRPVPAGRDDLLGPRIPIFLTPRAAAVAAGAAFVPALVPAPAWAVLTAALLAVAGLAIADVLTGTDPLALAVTRAIPEVGVVGRTDEVGLSVTNPTGRRLVIGVHDASAPSLERSPRRHHEVVLPPHGTRSLQSVITPTRRGRRAVGPLTVRVAGPLGVAGRQRTWARPGTVKVHPNLPGRRAALASLRNAQRQPVGSRTTRLRGHGTTFDSLREYHPDDPYRQINWLATARVGSPITTVFTEERNQQVVILLDSSRVCAGSVGGVPRVEWSIDAAVALADVAARFNDHVGVATFDDHLRSYVAPRPGRRQAARVLDAIFDVEPSLRAPAYRSAFASLLARHRRRSLLVLLTDLVDDAAMAPLIQALPVLLGRHLVTVAAVRDGDVERQARALPDQPEQVYAKTAAAAVLEARQASARRLRRLGAHVVDEPPTRLAAALAEDYIAIKRAGSL